MERCERLITWIVICDRIFHRHVTKSLLLSLTRQWHVRQSISRSKDDQSQQSAHRFSQSCAASWLFNLIFRLSCDKAVDVKPSLELRNLIFNSWLPSDLPGNRTPTLHHSPKYPTPSVVHSLIHSSIHSLLHLLCHSVKLRRLQLNVSSRKSLQITGSFSWGFTTGWSAMLPHRVWVLAAAAVCMFSPEPKTCRNL